MISTTTTSTTTFKPRCFVSTPQIATPRIDAKGNVIRNELHRCSSSRLVQKPAIVTEDLVASTSAFCLVAACLITYAFLLVAFPQIHAAQTMAAARSHIGCETGRYGADAIWPKSSLEPLRMEELVFEQTEPKRIMDDDKALQIAFETDFTCKEVVTADASQCNEQTEDGQSVHFFCPLSCSVESATAHTAAKAETVVSFTPDGDYNNYNAAFIQCAAVGSGDGCASSESRGQGCACESSSQCGAVNGAKCCYQGFCSYEHLAPLDPCL